MKEMDALRIAEELKKHNLNEPNRLSKDSGVVDIELIKPANRLSAPEGSQQPHLDKHPKSTSLGDLDDGMYGSDAFSRRVWNNKI